MSERPERYSPNRYSPIKPEVMLRLPESNARAFWIASTLGRFLGQSGSSEKLLSGKDATGTLVTKRRAILIRDELGISPQRWRVLVADWEQRRIAHRCRPGEVFLFAKALYERCPACRTELLVTEMAPSPRRNRGKGFARNARDASANAQLPQALRATTASADAQLPQASSGTNGSHRKNRSLPRDEVGMGSSGLQEPEEVAAQIRRPSLKTGGPQ
jgi:hypothetical protein